MSFFKQGNHDRCMGGMIQSVVTCALARNRLDTHQAEFPFRHLLFLSLSESNDHLDVTRLCAYFLSGGTTQKGSCTGPLFSVTIAESGCLFVDNDLQERADCVHCS